MRLAIRVLIPETIVASAYTHPHTPIPTHNDSYWPIPPPILLLPIPTLSQPYALISTLIHAWTHLPIYIHPIHSYPRFPTHTWTWTILFRSKSVGQFSKTLFIFHGDKRFLIIPQIRDPYKMKYHRHQRATMSMNIYVHANISLMVLAWFFS